MDSSPSPIRDREPSPDWLRTFEAPLKAYKALSLSSSSSDASPRQSSQHFNLHAHDDDKEEWSEEANSRIKESSVVSIGSDHEYAIDRKFFSTRVTSVKQKYSPSTRRKDGSKSQKPATGNEGESIKQKHIEVLRKGEEIAHEEDGGEGHERRTKRVVSSLPLVFGEKVHRTKVLLECEDDALDLSGDVGAVGRLNVPPNSMDDFLLDLKGVIYKGTIVPSNTFFVVNIGQSEAKVEAIMNDFVQLQPSANVFESETMVEGTLEGFGFDIDDDRDYVPAGTGTENTDAKEGKKDSQLKRKSDKYLKVIKSSVKKTGKLGTSKSIGKGAGTRKPTANSKLSKKSKTPKRGK